MIILYNETTKETETYCSGVVEEFNNAPITVGGWNDNPLIYIPYKVRLTLIDKYGLEHYFYFHRDFTLRQDNTIYRVLVVNDKIINTLPDDTYEKETNKEWIDLLED